MNTPLPLPDLPGDLWQRDESLHRAAELIDFGRAAVRRAKDEILEQLEVGAAS